MYNRYIRNDNGSYTRIPQEEQRPPRRAEPPPPQAESLPSPPPPQHAADTISGLLRTLLDRLHLNQVDTGDLLLLGVLFLLFREEADEELLVALGLLLIL